MAQPADIWITIQCECPECEEIFDVDGFDNSQGDWIIVTCPHCDCELYDEKPSI